jgi:hypothetical protein
MKAMKVALRIFSELIYSVKIMEHPHNIFFDQFPANLEEDIGKPSGPSTI